MTNKAYALFIHGLHSDKDSSTGQTVKEILQDYGYETITESFDVLDFDKTVNRIKELKQQYRVSLVVGHSLGGYYALICGAGILINPCLKPEIEIPKLLYEGEEVTEELANKWIDARERFVYYLDPEDRPYIYGIFAKGDELFSYADYFSEIRLYQKQMIEGNHKIPKEFLAPAFENIFDDKKEMFYRNPKGLSFPQFEMDEDDKIIAYYNLRKNPEHYEYAQIKAELEAKGIPTGVEEFKVWYKKWIAEDFCKRYRK